MARICARHAPPFPELEEVRVRGDMQRYKCHASQGSIDFCTSVGSKVRIDHTGLGVETAVLA